MVLVPHLLRTNSNLLGCLESLRCRKPTWLISFPGLLTLLELVGKENLKELHGNGFQIPVLLLRRCIDFVGQSLDNSSIPKVGLETWAEIELEARGVRNSTIVTLLSCHFSDWYVIAEGFDR
jgi:hypothetical protein